MQCYICIYRSPNSASQGAKFCYTAPMTLPDPQTCYRALKARDARFDGRFFTGVASTGIFCRPVCPARTPKIDNCHFFLSAAAALSAGYRPCLRCRPETAPTSAAWSGSEATIRRAIRMIELAEFQDQSASEFAARLGMSERHLRRLFIKHLGATFQQVVQSHRLLAAKQLLGETNLAITDITFAAGFKSVRRFNEAFKQGCGLAPRHFRQQLDPCDAHRAPAQDIITLRLPYRPPYDWDGLMAFLSTRAIEGIEKVVANTYYRAVTIGSEQAVIKVSNDSAFSRLIFETTAISAQGLLKLRQQARDFFDLDCDPAVINESLSETPALRPLVAANPGLRVPGCWSPFELMVRAVLGQQVTVLAARKIAERISALYGKPLAAPLVRDGLHLCFPTPEALVDAPLQEHGVIRTRAQTIRALAAAILGKEFEDLAVLDLEPCCQRLVAIKGIGPWSAHYIAMRAYKQSDAFPPKDAGLVRAARDLLIAPDSQSLDQHVESWRPWRAYGALHLWSTL